MIKFLLILLCLVFLTIPVDATTLTKTHTQGALGDNNLTGNYFWLYNTDYKSIRNITISGLCPQVNCRFLKPTDSTTFTIISGGSGTGTFTYRNETDLGVYDPADGNIYYRLTWTFTNTNLVSNVIYLSYSSAILDTVVARSGGATSPADVTANIPAIMVRYSAPNNFTFAGDYTTVVDTTIPPTINYWTNSKTNNNTLAFNVDPQESVTFSANATETINTWQWFLDGVNQSVNFNSFTTSFSEGTHNLSVSARHNTLGTSDPITWTITSGGVVTRDPGSGGSPSGQIYFDGNLLNIGNNYGINVSMTSSNFSSFNVYYIDTYEPGGKLVDGFPIEFNTQTYSTGRLFTFNKVGTWYSNLSYCSYINFLCPSVMAPTLIDTATATILPVSYTYNVTTDKPNYGFNDNITITATNPSLSTVYLNAIGPIGGSPQILTEIAWNTPVAPNSVKIFNASISPAYVLGTYYINMLTSTGYTGLVARTQFNITMPSTSSNTLGISWNDLHPTLGKSDILSYTSNYNISTVTIYNTDLNNLKTAVRTLQVIPNSSGNVSVTFTTGGLWYASIQDQNTSTKIVWSNTSVFAGNPTDWDVQKICTTTENYACWEKTQYEQGQSYIVNYKVKFQSNLMNPATRPNLQFFDPDNELVKTIKLNFTLFNDTIMGSTSGTFSKSAKTGIWIVKLSNIDDITGDNNGELANSATEVIAINRTTATTDIPSGSNAVSSVGDNLKILMSQVFFWGLILLIIFTITVYRGKFVDTHRSLAVLAFAFLETIGGLFAPYTITVFAILVIIIAISFRKGQETVSGEP